MSELLADFGRLSPAKQKLLLRRLQGGAGGATRQSADIPRSPLRATTGRFPLSFAQRRLWFLAQLEPGQPSYHIPSALRLSGPLAVPVLARSLGEIVRRHESLRTVFEMAEGEPVQRIEPARPLPLPLADLSGLASDGREAEALRLAVAEAGAPFDVDRGPHLRATLLRLGDLGEGPAGESEHVLLFTMHHIVSDGWSMGVLVREVRALYAALAAGAPSPLPELPIQYPDFADWQRSWLTGAVLERQLASWRERLASLPAVLELPADRPRPPVQGFAGAHLGTLLPRPLAEALRGVREREGDTLFMTLLAAFGALLSRVTGQDDLPLGSPIANRNRLEVEGLIGFFVNTLVLRVELAGDPGFHELLARVRETTLAAYAYQDLPFEKLVEELRPERDLARTPLFQVMFVLQNATGQAAETAAVGPALAPIQVPNRTSKFDLTLTATEGPAGLALIFEYRTDLFDAATVRRLLGSFEALLAGIVAQPGRRVSELPLLAEAERHQLLREWNDTAVVPHPEETVLDRFERRVALAPEAVAVVFEGCELTYRDLDRRANRWAHELVRVGVGPEVLVGVHLGRGPDMIAALLGIHKAGGAYLPLDPTFPADRLEFMARDAGLKVVLSDQPADRRPFSDIPVLSPEGELMDGAEAIPGVRAAPENLAYVLYTSGSTGRPKGVQITHRALANFLLSMQERPGLGVADVLVAVTTLSFDIAGLEIFLPLVTGGRVVLASRETTMDGVLLARLLEDCGATVLQATPVTWKLLLQAGWTGSRRLRMLCGGEALPKELARALLERGAELWNVYGPTETTIWSTLTRVELGEGAVTIGRPIAATETFLLDEAMEPVPVGSAGALYLSGEGLARGYLGRPALTAERFVPHPYAERPGARLYCTGDLARFAADGQVEFLGRVDHQVKVRGFRIEPGEIEAALGRHPLVREAAVLAREVAPGDLRLIAWVAPTGDVDLPAAELRAHLRQTLPEHMIPSAFVTLSSLPRTANGKLDRAALPAPAGERSERGAEGALPRTELERAIAGIWRQVLGVEQVGVHDNFFDLGGHSLLLVDVHGRLRRELGAELTLVDLFRYPQVAALAAAIAGADDGERTPTPAAVSPRAAGASRDVAVIGMAGRFPGADGIAAFWSNLRAGVESIAFFSADELRAAGVPEPLIGHPDHVPARGLLDGAELFDAGFFDVSPREAQLTDPQQRLFLETAAEALEDAGYDPSATAARIGVFGGTGISTYGIANLFSNPDVPAWAGVLELMVGNDKDFLATRTSYKLNLRGPAVTVQTACSTSLVAVHTACRSLLDGECEMALAGGVSVRFPQRAGYVHQQGGIESPDGHCRAFDAAARGTVGGDGVGIVVLKPLAAALADGDVVHAVIRGSAINNDGAAKVGYTAPSVDGQARAIAEAQAVAGVSPDTVQYVETHGSATPLGDPIEVAALVKSFGRPGDGHRCALGSVKTNVGHLDAAAGVTGLIKAVLALRHGEIPPSLHFETPNPEIDFGDRFYVNTALAPWPANGGPRRAGVSSFGLGGTNVHVVLEEAPPLPAPDPAATARPYRLVVLSARSEEALERRTDDLARHLESHPDLDLADVAFTCQVGRRALEHRRAVVAASAADAREALAGRDPRRVLSGLAAAGDRPVAFVFPGLGDHAPGMGAALYRNEPVFRQEIDRCAGILEPFLGLDLRDVIYPAGSDGAAAGVGTDLRRMLGRGGAARDMGALARTAMAQPAVFAVEYALARLWMSYGVRPAAMIGYSLGEYVAATVAGVLSLPDALRLVAERARWIGELPAGAMLAVPLAEEELAPLLGEALSLAAVNGPRLAVAAGPEAAVADLEGRLAARGVASRRLETSHAFHSRMMLPVAPRLAALARRVERRAPQIPYLSNVTGGWMTGAAATDPEYWVRHLCEPVRFGQGIAELWREPARVLLEVGPGASLTSLALQHPAAAEPGDRLAVPSLPSPWERQPEPAFLLHSLGKLWLAGVGVEWQGLHAGERPRRVTLPTYPFERQRFWIEPGAGPAARRAADAVEEGWRAAPLAVEPAEPETPAVIEPAAGGAPWLIFAPSGDGGLTAGLAARLERDGLAFALVTPGDGFARLSGRAWTVAPGSAGDCGALLDELGELPRRVLYLWGFEPAAASADEGPLARLERAERLGFASLVALLRALGAVLSRAAEAPAIRVLVAADRLHRVRGNDPVLPERSALLAPCDAAAGEHPGLLCGSLDLGPGEPREEWAGWAADLLVDELSRGGREPRVAYRGGERWVGEVAARSEPQQPVPASRMVGAEVPRAGGHARPNLRNAYVPPATALERELAGIWQGLLGIDAIGRHDSFFEMGGHSLLATQLMTRLRESFGVDLPLAGLFETPTVAELAVVVAQRREEGPGELAAEALPVLVPDPEHRHEPFPLTDIQQAYWLGRGDAFELGKVGAHIYFEFDFQTLDLDRLNRSLRRVIDRHEMLRAVFLPDGRQRILAEVPPYVVATIDLRDLSAEKVSEALDLVRLGMSHQVLRPDRWPLFEMRAARLPGGVVRVYLSVDVLIGDGWSFELLGRDIATFYADPDAPAPALELSFRDYVLAEATLRESGSYARSLAYWQERLATLPPAPELPMAKPSAMLGKPTFTRFTSGLDAASWERLKSRGAEAGLTPSGLLLAAFSEVLAAWSKTPRLTITLTLFNRLPVHPQINDIIGDFTTLTLLGVDVSGDGTFEARARAVQERLWRDLEHRAVSGVRVLRELARVQGRQGTGAMPVVFTSTLNLPREANAGAAPATALGGLPFGQMVYSISQTPQVWLDHQVGEAGGALTFNWDVVEELFPPGLIAEMFATYCALLRRLLDEPELWGERRLALAPAEHLARRAAVNATAAPASDALLHELFAATAARQPDHPAVVAPGRTLRYGELARLANRLGRRLRARGARPDTLVAVVQEKGWEQVASVLGVLVSGAAYLPIEPSLPRERRFHLLERGEVELVLTQPGLDAALEWPDGIERLVVDASVLDEPPGPDDLPLSPAQSPDDLAYVIFTSGSTGQPKGVMIEHRGAVNTILDVNQRFGVGPEDRVLALSSLAFDLSVYDIFGLLAAGGTIVMPRADAARDPAHWVELLGRERVTIWNSVPALMKLLVDHVTAALNGAPAGAVPLRAVLLSGDWIPLDLPDGIRAIVPDARVTSLGGATEASIWSILHPIDAVDPAWRSIPYGRPMLNQTFAVLDERLEARPELVPGQLYIGGIGLARGYWRDEEKTRSSFVTHPVTGERLYRTGDLGRYLPDGTIEFLGREDFQVKVQGYRIELGEIEAALLDHPEVAAAVAAAVGEQLGTKRLVAWVVTAARSREAWEAIVEGLRVHLRARLPEYMVPAVFVPLAALPLGPNGKVDRRALPAPEQALAERRAFVAPRTPTEEALAAIWSELLGVPTVGAHDNFYELGGDSLLATQVLSRVREALAVELPLQTLFESVTLGALAEAVDRAAPAERLEVEKLARLVATLEQASPAEVERMLAELKAGSADPAMGAGRLMEGPSR